MATLAGRFRSYGWAHLIEPRRYDPPNKTSSSKILLFKTSEEQQACVNTIMDKVLSSIDNLGRADFAGVEWALNEITDNVLNHSQSQIGGIVQVTLHSRARRAIEFTVCDGGLGVAHTLREAHPEIVSDIAALEESVKERVTRNSTTNQGNGLFGSFEMCRVSGGIFRIHANNARFELDDGVLSFRNDVVPFSGTMVDMTIDISNRGILEQALKFKGSYHKPSDIIEHKYEADDLKSVKLVMSEEVTSFASRISGRPIKIKLKNIVEMCDGQTVVIDFSGVSVISSSFADEVFGMLFLELGPMKFMSSIVFVNDSPTIRGLIDRAIMLRMRQGHGASDSLT